MAEKFDSAEEPKDRTMLVWIGIFVMLVGMVAALSIGGAVRPISSSVTVKHILVMVDRMDPAERARGLELITELRQRIVDGESFEKLAREYSDDPGSKTRGGYLGEEGRGKYDKNFEEYVWFAPIGALSDIVPTSNGFHLIVVLKRSLSKEDLYNIDLDRRVLEEKN